MCFILREALHLELTMCWLCCCTPSDFPPPQICLCIATALHLTLKSLMHIRCKTAPSYAFSSRDMCSGCVHVQGEKLLHKPGKGAFYNTELETWLQAHSITHLLFAGVTTEVP